MKLCRVTVDNFRCYKDTVSLAIGDLTALVGKNDVGKSTIFEALEIFFNNDRVKFEQQDLCNTADDSKVRITCCFTDLPKEIILDSSAITSLRDEYLLNSDGLLEIVKVYDCSLKNPKEKVFLKAIHPTHAGAKGLLQCKNADLKRIATDLDIPESEIDYRSNPSLRKAIYGRVDDLGLQEQLIPVDKEDAKSIWDNIRRCLPLYALFQSDRASRDDDSEVQDPMSISIMAALKEMEDELESIKGKVQAAATDVANRTLDKLRRINPDIAAGLVPDFRSEPKWSGLFKLTLNDDQEVPVNKRGSGVRRLILLSFFSAEAERRQEVGDASGIIYAIEEPETSQHPANQELLAEVLSELSEQDGCQVMITTHTPGLAGILPKDSLRFIEAIDGGSRIIHTPEDSSWRKIADQLGVLPDRRVQLFVCVEGPNDIAFFKHISSIIHETDKLVPDLKNEARIALISMGGDTLKQWVQGNYLSNLDIPEAHIYDKDLDSKYEASAAKVNAREDGSWATVLKKRTIENYLHPEAIQEEFGISVTFNDDDDVVACVKQTLGEQKNKSLGARAVKKRLNNEIAARMTRERLLESDPDNEICSWLKKVGAQLR